MIDETHLGMPHFRFIACYAAKKLKNLPVDLFDFNDVQ